MRQYVLLDSGGTLRIATDGALSSGAITLYGSGGTVAQASVALTDTGASTTTDAAAGPSQTDPTLLPVTSESGFLAGDSVLITHVDGRTEHHRVLGVSTGELALERELQWDVDIGSAVETAEVSYSVGSDVFSDPAANCRARWSLVRSGVTTVKDLVFDVVRSPVLQPLTEQNLSENLPLVTQQLPSTIQSWAPLLERSWARTLNALDAAGLYPEIIISDDDLLGVHCLAFQWTLAELGVDPQVEILGGAVSYFRGQFHNEINELKVRWLDRTDNLTPGADERGHNRQGKVIP